MNPFEELGVGLAPCSFCELLWSLLRDMDYMSKEDRKVETLLWLEHLKVEHGWIATIER